MGWSKTQTNKARAQRLKILIVYYPTSYILKYTFKLINLNK